MSSTTSRMGFYKPDSGDNVNVTTDLNNNWDLIDSMCGFAECTSTTRPSVVWPGLCVFETDTEQTFVSNGTDPASASWINIPNGSAMLESTGVNITGATTDTNVLTIQVTGDANKRLIVEAGGTLLWGDGTSTQDTNLYRSASETLKTDDSFTVSSLIVDGMINSSASATGDEVLSTKVSGDTQNRFSLYGDGRLGWGTGSAVQDAFLSRTDVGQLTIDNDFTVDGNLYVEGIGQTRFIRKEVDTQRLNTTTLQDDPELVLPLDANSIYEVEMWLAMTSDGDVDIKTAWVTPTGSTGLKGCIGATSNSAKFTSRIDTRVRIGVHDFGTSVNYQLTTDTFHQWSYERGLVHVGATAGDIILQWAPASLSASFYSEMGANSYMKVTKVA